MIYNLRDAAHYIGVPQDILMRMAWANTGPAQSGKSYWNPTFTRDALDAYLAENPAKPHNSTPIVKPGVWAVKRMRQRA